MLQIALVVDIKLNQMEHVNYVRVLLVIILIKLIIDVILSAEIHLKLQKKNAMMVINYQEMDAINFVKRRNNSFVKMEYVLYLNIPFQYYSAMEILLYIRIKEHLN